MKKLFWIGTFPDYKPSVGDHAQTLAVQKMLAEQFRDFEVVRFSVDEAKKFLDISLGVDDLVFLHSGGGFGDLYLQYHELRKKIITHCGCNRVVQLPVSVHYMDASVFECDKIFFSDKPNMLILCRSQKDADWLSGNFGCHVAYWPDFVYSLKPKLSGARRDGVLLVLRSDSESDTRNIVCRGLRRFSRQPLRRLGRLVGKDLHFVFCRAVIWLDRRLTILRFSLAYFGALTVKDAQTHHGVISDCNREKIVNNAFSFYSHFKIVITDRFHGLIFAHMAGAETIALPTRIKNKTLNLNHPNPDKYFPRFRVFISNVFKTPLQEQQPINKIDTEIIDVICRRRSIRKWTSQPVPFCVKEQVLLAGAYAPTAANTQSVRLISIDDLEKISFLIKCTSVWFKNSLPKWIVVVCVDLKKTLKPKWTERFIWQDTACAMQNMMLTVESLGLGSCWGSTNPELALKIHKFLGLPKNFMVACMLLVGYKGMLIDYVGAMHQGRRVKRCLAEIIVSNVFSDSLTANLRAKTEGSN